MSESNNLPQAISHKKLSYLMLKAQKDSLFSDELAEIENSEEREFEDLINNWEDSTKKVVNELSKRKTHLTFCFKTCTHSLYSLPFNLPPAIIIICPLIEFIPAIAESKFVALLSLIISRSLF